jgi:butyrate kinase
VKTILTINPGSTSTKIAVFEDLEQVYKTSINHSAEELSPYNDIAEQKDFRKEVILQALAAEGFDLAKLDAVIGRGGVLKPMESGVFAINDIMLHDLTIGIGGKHASNLGGLIAHEIAGLYNIPSYIADPVVVDELADQARMTGLPEIERVSIFHALNQKAVAKRHAEENQSRYEDLNLIVAHLGGGISVGAHKKGRVVDVNNALDGEGPFSPERSGSLPVGALAKLCYSGKYTLDEIKKLISSRGGMVAHLGTNSMMEVSELVEKGDPRATLLYNALAYQIGKQIGAMAAALYGDVDAILITGGIARDEVLVEKIIDMVVFIAPVFVYPGEDELTALAENCYRALNGIEEVKEYT